MALLCSAKHERREGVEKNQAFIDFCHKVHLDPRLSEKMRLFVQLKYLDNQKPEVIAKCLGVAVEELTELEAALLRHQQEVAATLH